MPSTLAPKNSNKLFLGWRMVAVAFFVDFIAVGFFFYSYGVFFKSIADEFGNSRLGISIGITITQAVGAILAPIIGRALDHYPLKNVIICGATAMGIGFVGLGFVKTATQFYLVLGIFIGFGAGSMGQLSTSKLVNNWFFKHRGRALGIAATGISVSGVIMPAITTWLIATSGWRSAFILYGAITLIIVIPIVLKFVVSKPEDVGLLPDGASSPLPASAIRKPASTREFLSNRNFWVLVAILGLLFCIQSATLIHMIPQLTDRGLSPLNASFIASASAGFAVAGKLTFGALVDKWDVRHALWLAIASQIIGQLIMLNLSGYNHFLLGACLFGFGMGGIVPMQSAVIGAVFGRESFGRVLGATRPGIAILQLMGIPFAGWVFDTTGSYKPAFTTFLVLYFVAAAIVYLLKVKPYQQHLNQGISQSRMKK
ncbi:MAG: MFS transporter [Pseudomonadales bacterium]|nr:MFS transporter [Pseudomonadales bacterium]